MKSECWLCDENYLSFRRTGTVWMTVSIIHILFDRFSMTAKPERSACETDAAKGLGLRICRVETQRTAWQRCRIVRNLFCGFSLWRKFGCLTSWRNLTIFVVRDPFGLRATANSLDLSCGSLIVKIKTLPMADAAAARPSVLYLALCIIPTDEPLLQRYAHAAFVWKRPVLTFIGKLNMNLILIWKMIFSLI